MVVKAYAREWVWDESHCAARSLGCHSHSQWLSQVGSPPRLSARCQLRMMVQQDGVVPCGSSGGQCSTQHVQKIWRQAATRYTHAHMHAHAQPQCIQVTHHGVVKYAHAAGDGRAGPRRYNATRFYTRATAAGPWQGGIMAVGISWHNG